MGRKKGLDRDYPKFLSRVPYIMRINLLSLLKAVAAEAHFGNNRCLEHISKSQAI